MIIPPLLPSWSIQIDLDKLTTLTSVPISSGAVSRYAACLMR